MRNGHKPRREPAVEMIDSPVTLPEAAANDLASLAPAPADDASADDASANDPTGQQLSLDSLDEPAEVLVRISPEALAGDGDLGGESGAGIEQQTEPEPVAVTAATAETAEAAGTAANAPHGATPAYPVSALDDATGEHVAQSMMPAEDEPGDEVAEGDTDELQARLIPDEPAAPLPVDDPSLQIRLARIHLRTGSLTLARAELETLAGRHQLDTEAHLHLAEARWRTGDLQGAGEAAAAYLAAGGNSALGFVISAESAAMDNRHAEARRHTEQALERQLSELDPVFAGMPRKAAWTPQAWNAASADATPAQTTAPATPVEVESAAVPVEPEAAPAEVESAAAPVEPEAAPAEVESAAVPVEPEAAESVESAADVYEPAAAEPSPAEPLAAEYASGVAAASAEVTSGRAYLDANDSMMAALHFGVAIRLAPESAGAVLEAIGERQDLPLQLVRGDALRLLGLEADAGKAYQSVASALGAPKPVAPDAAPDLPSPMPATPEPPAVDAEPAPPADTPELESRPELSADEPPPIRWD